MLNFPFGPVFLSRYSLEFGSQHFCAGRDRKAVAGLCIAGNRYEKKEAYNAQYSHSYLPSVLNSIRSADYT
jgi:hypothetical protein